MLCRNGVQLAGRSVRNAESVAARGFFEVLWRWSMVRCQAPRRRRNYGTRSTICQRIPSRRAQFPAPGPIALYGQQRPNSSTPESAAVYATFPDPDVKGAEKSASKSPEGPLFDQKSPSSTASPGDAETTNSGAPAAGEHNEPLFNPFPSVRRSSEPAANTSAAESPPTEEEVVWPESEPSLSHNLRTIMRTLSSSVVVLTTTSAMARTKDEPHLHGPITKKYKNYRGMTLSSFATLALSPEPIITFNIRAPSSTLIAISTSKRFLIHVLDSTPEGARIANHFTKGNGKASAGFGHGGVFRDGEREEVFGIKMELTSHFGLKGDKYLELPRLQGTGVRKVLKCELLKGNRHESKKKVLGDYGLAKPLIVVGDHVLVLGRVVEILEGGGKKEGESKYGLSYVDGRYRRGGEAISLKEY